MKLIFGKKFDEFDNVDSISTPLISEADSNVTLHHIVQGDGIQVTCTTDPLEDINEVVYYVLSGEVRVDVEGDKNLLKEHESVCCRGDGKIIIWGIGANNNVLYFSRSTSTLSDNIPPKIYELLTEAERKDNTTRYHNRRVARIAIELLHNIDPSLPVVDISVGAAFHDIGKVEIPEAILNKPGKLTSDEFEIIKRHPLYSERILEPFVSEKALFIAKHHQELLDGSGYPDGLKGDEIPLEVRCVTVADVYDALTSKRPYRTSLTNEEAFAIMDANFKGKIDEHVYAVLKELVRKDIINKELL